MILFSERQKLARLAENWISERVQDKNPYSGSFNVISFLYDKELLNEEVILKMLSEETIEEKIKKKYNDFYYETMSKPKYLILSPESLLSLQKSIDYLRDTDYSIINPPQYMGMKITILIYEKGFYVDVS